MTRIGRRRCGSLGASAIVDFRNFESFQTFSENPFGTRDAGRWRGFRRSSGRIRRLTFLIASRRHELILRRFLGLFALARFRRRRRRSAFSGHFPGRLFLHFFLLHFLFQRFENRITGRDQYRFLFLGRRRLLLLLSAFRPFGNIRRRSLNRKTTGR